MCFRVRARSSHSGISLGDQRLFNTLANGLIASMAGFLVAGAFIALAFNDITWLTFALIAALDRLSAKAIEQATPATLVSVFPGRAANKTVAQGTPAFVGNYRSPGDSWQATHHPDPSPGNGHIWAVGDDPVCHSPG